MLVNGSWVVVHVNCRIGLGHCGNVDARSNTALPKGRSSTAREPHRAARPRAGAGDRGELHTTAPLPSFHEYLIAYKLVHEPNGYVNNTLFTM